MFEKRSLRYMAVFIQMFVFSFCRPCACSCSCRERRGQGDSGQEGRMRRKGSLRKGLVVVGCPCSCHFNSPSCDPIHHKGKKGSRSVCRRLVVSCRSYIHALLVINGVSYASGSSVFFSLFLSFLVSKAKGNVSLFGGLQGRGERRGWTSPCFIKSH